MDIKLQIPFQQLLDAIKKLTPAQKARLKQELLYPPKNEDNDSNFTQLLLNGPVFTDKQIQTIKENGKSIARWRTKS
jgi:hypothetical protein